MKNILLTGSLRSPPFGGCATTFPPQAGALQPVLNLESLMKKLPHGALFCHRLRGKSREAGKGECLSDARQGGCMVFAAKGGIKMAPKAPYLASAAILYDSRGREPSTRPGGVSRSRTEPLAPRARGPAAPSTLAAKPRQPSGILESTASPTGIYRHLNHLRFLLRVFCIECASRPKLALSLHIKGPSFYLADRPF